MVNIAGAGLTGMSCALKLIESEYDVRLYESRQEIGNPIRSPGFAKNINLDFVKISLAKQSSLGWGFRREWYEKAFAELILIKGGEIFLKTEAPDNSINCKGGKSISSGWPNSSLDDTLTTWNGGIVIESDLPKNIELNSKSPIHICFQRGDDLVEYWTKNQLPNPSKGWLEIMQGEHPNDVNLIGADDAIAKGISIAQDFISNKGGSI
jgi:hypothetical protein